MTNTNRELRKNIVRLIDHIESNKKLLMIEAFILGLLSKRR